MDRAYYEAYKSYERNHWWFRARNKILISLVKKYNLTENPEILNVGAATGFTSELLAKTGTVTSLEYDHETYEFLKNELNLKAVEGSVLQLPFAADSFDIVCAFDVIEHVDHDKLAVSEMLRVCRPGGLLMVTVPAYQFLWSDHDVINHHFRRYRRTQLLALFGKHSVHHIYSGYFNTILFLPIAVIRVLQRFRRHHTLTDIPLHSDFDRYSFYWVNKLLYLLFSAENYVIKSGLRFLFGVSIVGVFRKK